MTQSQQRAAIRTMIKNYTKAGTKTKQTALATLVAEGIYTKSGKITKRYGGSGSKLK